MKEVVALLLKNKGLSEELLDQLPTRWERLGDIVVLPTTSFNDPVWDTLSADLWTVVAKSLGARRLARQVLLKEYFKDVRERLAEGRVFCPLRTVFTRSLKSNL